MKKLITIILILIFPILVFSQQATTPDPKNWKHTGTNTFTKPITVESKSLTGAKITSYDNLVIDSGDTLTVDGNLVQVKDSIYRKKSYATRYDFKYESTLGTRNLLKAAGSNVTVTPFAIELSGGNTTPALVDGTIYYNMVVVTDSTLLTSFQYSLSATGNFTGDNNNVIGIYSFANPTFTKIGNTATDVAGAKWKVSTALVSTSALVTPVWLAPGKYAIMYLYNSSAQTTAPSVYGLSLPYVLILATGLPNTFYPFGISNAATYTDLPATIAASAFTFTNNSAIIFGF